MADDDVCMLLVVDVWRIDRYFVVYFAVVQTID